MFDALKMTLNTIADRESQNQGLMSLEEAAKFFTGYVDDHCTVVIDEEQQKALGSWPPENPYGENLDSAWADFWAHFVAERENVSAVSEAADLIINIAKELEYATDSQAKPEVMSAIINSEIVKLTSFEFHRYLAR